MTNDEFFAAFTRSAWRLETLPAYGTAESDPDFAAYLTLGHLPPLDERPAKQAWMAAVRRAVAQGKQLGRVHVLRRPLSPYLAYELATYPENVAAGEDVRIADINEHPALVGLGVDFWLLDDKLVLILRYDDGGRFQRLTQSRNPAIISHARWQRDLAIASSVPLQEFLLPA